MPELQRDRDLAHALGKTLGQFYSLPEDQIEDEVAAWESRREAERDTCPDCHQPRSICSDPDLDWFPERRVCWPTAILKAAAAMYEDAHQDRPYHSGDFSVWSKTRSYDYPFRYDEGVTLSLTEREVDTSWLTGAASPASTDPVGD